MVNFLFIFCRIIHWINIWSVQNIYFVTGFSDTLILFHWLNRRKNKHHERVRPSLTSGAERTTILFTHCGYEQSEEREGVRGREMNWVTAVHSGLGQRDKQVSTKAGSHPSQELFGNFLNHQNLRHVGQSRRLMRELHLLNFKGLHGSLYFINSD